jgi:hypothetical protein
MLGAVLFSILAHTMKNRTFFYISAGALVFVTIYFVGDLEYILYAIQSGNLMQIIMIACYILTIVFLVMHLTSSTDKNQTGKGVTETYLDEIIEGEDEEWDPES